MAALSWLAAAVFVFAGAVALIRPDAILAIRAKFRPPPKDDPEKNPRRRSGFGVREVRICGLVLVIISAALIKGLLA